MKVTLSFLLFALAGGLPAAIIAEAHGGTLAGGTVTAIWEGGFTSVQTIIIDGADTNSGRVLQPGLFNFNIDNGTQGNLWSVTNNRNDNLVSFTIDLTTALNAGRLAVFDDGRVPFGPPADPNRAVGSETAIIGGVTDAGNVALTNFLFSLSYQDPGNPANPTTNLFQRLTISSLSVGAGATFNFRTDSDLATVPEPATWLTALGFCALGLARRARR